MSHKRKICVITGSRAEYGLLYQLLKKLKKSKKITTQIIVTGSHLSKDHGETYKIIQEDGFVIDDKIEEITRKIPNAKPTTVVISINYSFKIMKIPPKKTKLLLTITV